MTADTVPDWLAQRARTHGEQPALRGGAATQSFAALAARAAVADARLQACGLRAGDRLALLVHNRPELVALLHGAPRRGRVVVPLGTRLAPAEIAEQLAAAECRLLLYESATRATAAALRDLRPTPALCIDNDALPGDRRWRDVAFDAFDAGGETPPIALDSAHSILFTSGSVGRAKGVLLTWGNHFWNALGSAFNLGVRDDDCWLACLPMHHVGGLSILMRSVLGATPVLLQARFDAALANRAIERGGVTLVSLVANMLARLLDERGDAPFPPTLRGVLLGGGPAPAVLLERCRALAVPLLPTYGMTETASQIATAAPARPTAAPQSVGRPLLGVELRIVDAAGGVCAPHATGEIQVRGPVVSPGYLGAPPRRGGAWFATGDLGSLDERGELRVIGRADDTVVSGGENIHPSEIEQALESHPAVAESCAFGVDDTRWGQRLLAGVRLHDGADVAEEELRAHCAARLARFKVPRRIFLVTDFPRTGSGKLARRALATQLGRALDRGPGNPVIADR